MGCGDQRCAGATRPLAGAEGVRDVRNVQRFAGLGCLVLGSVWLLQGVGVQPGSFMTGQTFWAWAGAGVLGIGAFLSTRPRRR